MADSKTKPGASKPVRIDTTLQKGLQVLEALTRAEGGKGVTELSRELDLTKSNTFRLLQTLTALGYVRSSESKLYSPTLKVWQIAQSVIGNLDLPAIAGPHMRMLSQETNETIYLAVPDGLSVVYIDKIESTKPIRTWNPIGGSAPLHCVGTGKAILAADYGRLRPQIADHLTGFTERTLTTLKQLDEDMIATQKRGYAIDTGEFREQVYSFGSAILLPNGRVIGALGVSVPDIQLDEARRQSICDSVLKAATGVNASLCEL
ncbi:MAG: IclR family transcriptional regulator [Pseudomonadota bacterium]